MIEFLLCEGDPDSTMSWPACAIHHMEFASGGRYGRDEVTWRATMLKDSGATVD
jgi:hypothetical protein